MYEIAGYPLKMNKNYHMACSEIIILRSKNIFVEFKILIVMMWKLDEIYVWTTCSLLRHTRCIILNIYSFGLLFFKLVDSDEISSDIGIFQ